MLHSLLFGASPLSSIPGNPAAWGGRGSAIEGIVMGNSTDIKRIIFMPLSRLKIVLEILRALVNAML